MIRNFESEMRQLLSLDVFVWMEVCYHGGQHSHHLNELVLIERLSMMLLSFVLQSTQVYTGGRSVMHSEVMISYPFYYLGAQGQAFRVKKS